MIEAVLKSVSKPRTFEKIYVVPILEETEWWSQDQPTTNAMSRCVTWAITIFELLPPLQPQTKGGRNAQILN
jgi:hypothetical protein